MKRIVFTVLASVALFLNCYAGFVLTPTGFINEDDKSKDYIVYQIDGVSQNELYLRVLRLVNTSYVSPKNVLSEIKNDIITINGFRKNCIDDKKVLGVPANVYDINYTISIHFKDGRIKVDAPYFKCTSYNNGRPYRLTLNKSNGGLGDVVLVKLFKKNGMPARKDAINSIDSFFDGLVTSIVDAATNDVEDDW